MPQESPKMKTPGINDKLPDMVTLCGSLTVEAAESDQNKTGVPRFRMVAYTGGLMRIAGFPHPVVVDLAGLDIPSQNLPIRLDHDRRQGVGHTHSVTVNPAPGGNKPELVAEGLISRDTSWARDVARSGINGFPWQASIGAAVVEAEMVPAGSSVTVNGQSFTGPVHVVRRAVLKEISFVDSGADTNTTARIAANNKENRSMSDKQVNTPPESNTAAPNAKESNAPGVSTVESHDPQVQAKASDAADSMDTVNTSDSIQVMRREAVVESKRINTIRQLCDGKHSEIEAKAIEEGWDENRTELEVLRASRPTPGTPAPGNPGGAPGVINGRSTVTPKVIEAAACLATNDFSDDQLVKDYGEQTLDAAYRFRNIGVAGVIRLAAAAEGHYIPAVGVTPAEILEAAASTMSLPGILSNIANKSLLAGFDYVENAWRRIAKIGSVRDFKTVTRYRFTTGMSFEPIAHGGEFKHGEVGEESYTNKADTYGKMFGIYREDIINDDLDALKDLPFRIGEGAALTINREFWTLWLSNPSNFFSVANKNYKTGTDTALSIDGLSLARATFSKQRRPSASSGKGDPLGVRPKILLVPASLEILADQLMNSTTLNEAAGTPKSNKNPHANKFEVVASDYLDNEDYTGSSDKAWYLLAEPNAIPGIEVVFLNGKQIPTVESNDMVFNRLGIEFRGYLDFGIKEQDYRGALKMKGEA